MAPHHHVDGGQRSGVEQGQEVATGADGNLVIKAPWPGMARTIHGDPDRFLETYWKDYKKQGWYKAGDAARIDEDGYIWIIGRTDDVIKVAGYRLGSAEVESALASHEAVTEAAAIGLPHATLGQSITLLVKPKNGMAADEEALLAVCRQHLPAYMLPHRIEERAELYRNPNGKIDRKRHARELGAALRESEHP